MPLLNIAISDVPAPISIRAFIPSEFFSLRNTFLPLNTFGTKPSNTNPQLFITLLYFSSSSELPISIERLILNILALHPIMFSLNILPSILKKLTIVSTISSPSPKITFLLPFSIALFKSAPLTLPSRKFTLLVTSDSRIFLDEIPT